MGRSDCCSCKFLVFTNAGFIPGELVLKTPDPLILIHLIATYPQKKYIHIIDSKTGFPVDNEIASVTILSSSGTYADALSTALFVMGTKQSYNFWNERRDFEMLIFTKDKRIFVTKGIEKNVVFIDKSFEVYWWK